MKQDLNTILLIDDSYSNFIEGFSKMGKSFGFNVLAFDSITNGLSFLQSNINEIGAVLLDLSFSQNEYEGVGALREIKENFALLPVVVLPETYSAKDIEVAINCIQTGAFHYVVKKDFNPASLFQILKVAVSQYAFNINSYRYNALKEEYRNRIYVFEQMLQTTEMILKNTIQDKVMFTPTFEKRIKGFNSFYDKVLKKEKIEGILSDPFSRITDIVGLRVIFYNSADLLYAIDLLTNTNDFINIKSKACVAGDYKLKAYGYRAVHFDVNINPEKRLHLEEYRVLRDVSCEIQFKTIFAHSWSKVYHALSYKDNGLMKISGEVKKMLEFDFQEVAKNLETLEQQVTTLCKKYFPLT